MNGVALNMMSSGSKLSLYRTLRSQGLRLYACRSNILTCSFCGCNIKRNMNTLNQQEETVSAFNRYKERLGFKGALAYFPSVLNHAAVRLYISAAEAARYNKIYQHVELPDSVTSWHKLTSLHIWLIMSRLAVEGREGRFVRNRLVENFIQDTKAKSKSIGKEMDIIIKGEELEKLHEQFLASVLAYDEGLLGSDMELAGAIWRTLYDKQEDIDPSDLETMVDYVRKQVVYLQRVHSKQMLTNGLIPFLPVVGNSVSSSAYECLDALRKQENPMHKIVETHN